MIERLIKILREGHHSLVVRNEEIRKFNGRGVSDLYNLLCHDQCFLNGAEIADKVVGKGAAALMILGNINTIYAEVISLPALELLKKSSIKVSFGKLVPNIINRKGDGICPVERLCLPCQTAEECFDPISTFINQINTASQK